MTTTTYTKTARTLIAAATSCTAGGNQRAALDVKTVLGGLLTAKITNGATPPTVQAQVNIYAAHNATTPATGTEGTDWKLVATLGGGGVTASAVTPFSYDLPAGMMQLQVEVIGNTGQAVTCEAYLSEITSATSV